MDNRRPQSGGKAREAALLTLSGRSFLLLLALAVLAAAALRLWQIGERELWLDEAYSAWFSSGSWHDLWIVQPGYEVHPPLYYSLLKLWSCLAGTGPGALRLPSAIAGIAAVPLMALAARQLARLAQVPRPLLLVLVAAGLALFSSRLLLVSQEARPYSLLFLAFLGAVHGWLRLANDFGSGGTAAAGRWSSWAILGTGTIFVLWLHALGILYAAALFLALLLVAARPAPERPARWRRLAVVTLLVVLLYLPCVYLLGARTGDWSTGWLRWNPGAFPFTFLALFGLQSFGEPLPSLVALFLLPALCLLGLGWLWRQGMAAIAAGLALILLVPPLSAALISQLGVPVFLPRTQIGMLVPVYLLSGLAVAMLPRFSRWACVGLLALAFTVNLAQAVERPAQEPWAKVADHLRLHMGLEDRIWVYPNDRALPLRAAYGPGVRIEPIPAPFPALDAPGRRIAGSPAVVAVDAESAREWAAAHPPPPGATVWLLRQRSDLFDPGDRVAEALAEGRRPGNRIAWSDIDLQPLRPAAAD